MYLAVSVEQLLCPPSMLLVLSLETVYWSDTVLRTEELKRRRSQPSDTADAFCRSTAFLVALKQVANQATE